MNKIADFYKALGDVTRLTILQSLTGKEMCVCEIIERLRMSQPAISHHLKILKQAGLVKDCREGKWIYYSLNENVFAEVFGDEDLDVLKNYAEPIRQKLFRAPPATIRTSTELCRQLTGGIEVKEGKDSGPKTS